MSTSEDPPATSEVLDALIIGLGFSGTYLLHKLSKLGYNVLAVDANDGPGGVWQCNRYPGVRVDVGVPAYQFGIEELHDKSPFEWSEKFPGGDALRNYFLWVHDRLGLQERCTFGAWVQGAVWQEKEAHWLVTARHGRQWRTKWLLPCLGYAAKPLVPKWQGLNRFQGPVFHSAQWPMDLALNGRRVCVVGTGASGVQIVQTIASEVSELVVLQRTPATAIPMQQRKLNPGELTESPLANRLAFLENRKTRWDGSPSSIKMRSAKDDSPQQRETEFERLWAEGGFAFWTSNYMDLFSDKESNAIIYDFWKRRVRQRIRDGETQAVLAPDRQPYAFGTKRVPLEQSYFEAFNLPHVSLVDLCDDGIREVMPHGVKLASGKLIGLDILILATGFDISTGSFTQIDIQGIDGVKLAEKWDARTCSYLGLSIAGFPNMLYAYGPQSPANVGNGPVCAEVQGDFIVDVLEHAKAKGYQKMMVEEKAEIEYTDLVTCMLKGSLFEGTTSYYFRDNMPGSKARRREPIFWMAGLPAYIEKLEKRKKDGYAGFDFS